MKILPLSPQAITAQAIFDNLNNGGLEQKVVALRQLSELSIDNTFAQEFINKNGLHLLISMIESGS